MTTITVTNFRALKSAVIKLAKIVLIAADNEGGKTSFVQACRAVLTSQTMPIDGLIKKHASLLVHSGTTGCEISCASDEGETKITFPEMVKSVSGKPLEISEYASGAKSILDTETKFRSNIISDMLKCSPTKTELMKALGANDILDSVVADKIWQTVEAQGWDAALGLAKETGSKNKTLWESVTMENYGAKKASEWMPKEWAPDLSRAKREDLEGVLKQEQEWLEVAISDNAVNDSENTRLKIDAAKYPLINDKISKLEAILGNETQLKAEVVKILAGLPLAKQPDIENCPHCKQPLAIINGKISPVKVLTDAELKRRAENIKDAEEQIRILSAGLTTKNNEMIALRAQKNVALDADKKLKVLANQKPQNGNKKNKVEDCRTKVQAAADRLNAFDRRTSAVKYAALIETNQKIIEILSPAGLRLSILKNKLSEFNVLMKSLCDSAGWAVVELKDDMSITYRGTPFMLISTAAQFKTRCVLQVASAKIDGSPLVLIDAADVLASQENRNGLFKFLLTAEINAIVTMAFGGTKRIPNLNTVDGRSYWINDGTMEELNEPAN